MESLRDKCAAAFVEGHRKRALHLLSSLKQPKLLQTEIDFGLYWTYRCRASLLHLSSRNGWFDVVKDLITNYHFDPQETDDKGNTCLHYAAAGIRNVNGSLDVMKYLINHHHCNPMAINKDREPVLHIAVKHIDIVKYLITDCGCDPMTTSGYRNMTTLHYAARAGSTDVIKYLINDHNCDPMATDNRCEPVLHYAVKHIDIVKYLITECGCDPMTTGGRFNRTTLHYAAVEGSTDLIKYLINDCNCDPMSVSSSKQTPLHCAVIGNNSDAVEYLLSTGKCDPLARDGYGDTPMKRAAESHKNLVPIFKKFVKIKSSHPVDSYVNVLLLGNPGAGKSTLSHVIADTATGFVAFGTFRNVKGVEPCTAGIIPTKLQHKTLGNIILHDFAGHSEYYSSHGAVIENLLQGSGGVFLIVVNILEKEAIKQLHQWLTVVRNEAQKALDQCHIIVVASHVDEISIFHRGQMKEKIQEIIGRERCDSVYLDCRKCGGSGMDSFFNKLTSSCESIRSTSGRNLSLYCHMMYGLLEEGKENILTLSDVMSAAKDNDGYILPDEDEKTSDLLHSLDSIGLISVLKSEEKVWVIVNKGILLSEVNGILFAPETFKEHINIASNTGIVSVSGLTRLFPDYDLDMLICFLKKMELCQEMNPSFLEMTNLHQLSERGGRGERLLFFPSLLYSDRPDEMTSKVYQFGWCLQCTREHHFFPPRYFHVLSLHLAYKFALAQERDKLNRYCTFWRNGIHWFNGEGVGVLVEIVDESQCVLVLMSYQEGCSENMVCLRREVIGEVMRLYKESCPSLEVEELVIDPEELDYPVKTPRERTVYIVHGVLSAIAAGRCYLVHIKGQKELKSILTGESLSDISNLSLLGGRDIKVRIHTHIS